MSSHWNCQRLFEVFEYASYVIFRTNNRFLLLEFTSIRSGLRKRKRAESPQKTEPQVTEEWVDEDKLELWEIKQFGEK